jgi:spore coat protein U domain-containing protein, fimbrial subunit CupE1/2/3/6
MRKILSAALLGAVMLGAGNADALTATTTFQVSANVLKTCSVSSAALSFGDYTPGAGALNGTTTVSVKCTKSTGYQVALNGGTTTGGTIAQRLLANGTNTLQYNLYTTGTYATVWGDGTGTSVQQAGTGAGIGTANTVTVYGQLPDNTTNQSAVPGGYADTITVTVTY